MSPVSRLLSTGCVALLVITTAVGIATSRASAQATVTTEAQLRAAFADAAETTITLGADIRLTDCSEGQLVRQSDADLLLVGDGHLVRQTCMDRIMSVGPATSAGLPTVSLESVILLSGTTDGSGGALHVDGNVTVTRSVVQANSAGESGGGVFATGAVVVETSIFRRNSTGSPTCNAPSPCLGGAIFASGESGFGGVSISASRFTMNSSSDFGGAIGVNDTVTVAGSSFDLNRAGTQGGAISGGRRVELTNSTITDNEASACGGLDALEVNLLHTTVVLNEAATGANLCAETLLESDGSIVALPAFGNGPNCALDPAAVTRSSYSFAGDQSCQMVDATDRVGPPLASLGETSFNNGFTDQPIWVPFGDMGQEQFVDVIPSASCNVAQDQRGVPRPQGSACDIGSIEVTAGDVGGRPPGNKPPGHPGHHPPGNPHPGHHPPGNPHPGHHPPGNPHPGHHPPGNPHPGHHPPGNPHPGHHPPGNPHPGNPNPGARRPAN